MFQKWMTSRFSMPPLVELLEPCFDNHQSGCRGSRRHPSDQQRRHIARLGSALIGIARPRTGRLLVVSCHWRSRSGAVSSTYAARRRSALGLHRWIPHSLADRIYRTGDGRERRRPDASDSERALRRCVVGVGQPEAVHSETSHEVAGGSRSSGRGTTTRRWALDPGRLGGSEPRYAYVGGNPVNFVDPSGRAFLRIDCPFGETDSGGCNGGFP